MQLQSPYTLESMPKLKKKKKKKKANKEEENQVKQSGFLVRQFSML